MNIFKRAINKFRKIMFNEFYREKLQKSYRERLTNKDFTIICNNCFGGMLYHDLGMQFLSPTINMRFDAAEYIEFLRELEYYLKADLEYVGQLDGGGVLALLGGKIRLFGLHYETFEELKTKWYERRERVNLDNLFIIGSYIDDCNDDVVRAFCALPYKNKVFLSHKAIEGCDCVVVADCGRNANGFPGADHMLSCKQRFEDATFDFITWLNSGDGKNNG